MIPKNNCPYCNYAMDCASELFDYNGGDNQPQPGDASICLNCGKVSIFTKELLMRLPTKEEAAAIRGDERIVAAQIAQAGIVTKDLRR